MREGEKGFEPDQGDRKPFAGRAVTVYSTPEVPNCIVFPTYRWDGDREKFRRGIEAALRPKD